MELPEKRGKQLGVIPNFSKISLKILFIEITFDDIAKRCDKEIQSVPSLCNLIHTLRSEGSRPRSLNDKWKVGRHWINLSSLGNNQPSVCRYNNTRGILLKHSQYKYGAFLVGGNTMTVTTYLSPSQLSDKSFLKKSSSFLQLLRLSQRPLLKDLRPFKCSLPG